MPKITWSAGQGFPGSDGETLLRHHGVRVTGRQLLNNRLPPDQRTFGVTVSAAQLDYAAGLLVTAGFPVVEPVGVKPFPGGMPKRTWGRPPRPHGLVGWLTHWFWSGGYRPPNPGRSVRRRVARGRRRVRRALR